MRSGKGGLTAIAEVGERVLNHVAGGHRKPNIVISMGKDVESDGQVPAGY